MKKLAFVSFVFLTLIGGGLASNPTENLAEVYNNNTEEIPSPITSLINGEVVNVYLDTDIDEINITENESVVGIKMTDNKMKNITTEAYEDSTLDVHIYEEDVDQIKNASSPMSKTAKMISSGDIRYETNTLGTTAKTTIVETGLKILNFFS